MAMTIKGNPTLYGENAIEFENEAEKNGQLPTPRLSKAQKNFVRKVLASGKNIKFDLP